MDYESMMILLLLIIFTPLQVVQLLIHSENQKRIGIMTIYLVFK